MTYLYVFCKHKLYTIIIKHNELTKLSSFSLVHARACSLNLTSLDPRFELKLN